MERLGQAQLFVGDGRVTKVCRECGQAKLLADLKADKSKSHGRAAICKPCHREAMAVRYQKPETKAKIAEYLSANHDKAKKREYDKKRRMIYWRKKRHELLASTNERRGRIRAGSAKWANKFFIAEIYRLAVARTAATGIKWEVDHIVPVSSPLVCGLHCEANLQVITEAANKKKNNTVWPDMP